MVYLHGGSLVEGSSFAIQAGFGGPVTLANRSSTQESIVSVSLNYRLGVLGFLALDELADNHGLSGNYGLKDTLMALKWVHANIASFGGDPNRVTIYGQSSGGSLVFALMTSPHAVGLFQRAISMSGSPRLNSTLQEACSYWHPQVVDNIEKCQKNRTAACLRSVAPDVLVSAQPENWDPSYGWSSRVFWDSYQYAPLLVIDGDVLPFDYRRPFSSLSSSSSSSSSSLTTPLHARVPLMIGVTREEIDFAPGNDVRNMSHIQVANLLETALRNATNGTSSFIHSVLSSYGLSTSTTSTLVPIQGKNATPELIFSDFISDATMLCGTYTLADAWSSVSPNIYMYTVSERPGNPFCALSHFQKEESYCPLYSFHAIDMFAMYEWLPDYLTPGHESLYNATKRDVLFTKLVQNRLVDEFGRAGVVEEWERYTFLNKDRSVAVLNVENERMITDWRKEQCKIFMEHGFYETKTWVN